MEHAATTPVRPPLEFGGLPNLPALDQLKARDQWVAWQYMYDPKKGKWDKPPLSVKGGYAKSTTPSTWASYSAAEQYALRRPGTGVGYVLTPEDGLTGIDIDDCRDPATGKIDPWAEEVLAAAETYAEISPSGTGIRMFASGKVERSTAFKPAGVEIYNEGRYLTITGQMVPGSPASIRPAPQTLEALYSRIQDFKRKQEAEKPKPRISERLTANVAKGQMPLTGGDFFREVNTRALADLAAWFPSIFPQARYMAGTRGYRVSAASMGRNLEEDLSATPSGIVDFGVHDMGDARDGKRSAIDIVIEHQGERTAVDAAKWLCARLGLRPADLGFRDAGSNVTFLHDHQPVREQASVARSLPTVLASSFAGRDVPPREWHVEGMVPAKNVTLFFGDGGTGKSLATLQLAVSTIIGADWFGMTTATGRVLLLSAEDDLDEMHRRLNDIVTSIGDIDFEDLADLKLSPLAGLDAVLGAATRKGGLIEPTPLWHAFEAEAKAWRPKLIIVDTLADVYGGDEIARAQARQFIGMLRGLALETQSAVIVLAHPSLSGIASGSGTSGSTGWSNSVRSRLYLNRVLDQDRVEADPDLRVLSLMKTNYARTGTEIRLRWESGVFVRVDEPGLSALSSIAAQARAERIFLELLDTYSEEGRHVSSFPGPNYAPSIFAKDPRAAGLTKKALLVAMNFLFQSRHITNASYGPPSKQRSRIERLRREE